MFIAALFTITKIRNQAKCSFIDEWIEKIPIFHLTIYLYTHTHTHTHTHTLQWNINQIYKKNVIRPNVTTWIATECIILNEISQTEKDKYCIFLLICAI